jgi:inactivated superfamily I helicase
MSRHRLVAGSFSALEGALFGAIEALQSRDPLTRVEVAVPSNLLGLDLRRRYTGWLASRAGARGHANLRFPTFLDLARETAGDVPGRPAAPSLLFAAVASAISQVPQAARFGEVRHRVGFARAVEATLQDLRDAGISPEAFRAWVFADSNASAERRRMLEALGALHDDVARRLEGFADDVATFRAAALRAGAKPSGEPLFLYGFYDFTGLQRDLVVALAGCRPLVVFLPSYGGDLGGFARGTQTQLARILDCEVQPAEPEESPSDGSVRRTFLERFAARQKGDELPDDGTLALVSAADDASEAREAAREVLIGRELRQPLAGTAILVRQEADAARFDVALGRAGIPRFRRPADTWADTPAGRALALWLRLEEEGFRRDDVLDVLELSTVASPDPHAPHFRGLARQCGVVRGLDAWNAAVARLAAAADSSEEPDEDSRSRFASRLPGGPEAARRLALRFEALRDSASGWPAGPLALADWSTEAQRRIERLFAPDDVPEPAAAALDTLAALSEGGGEVSREVAFEVFLSGLASRAAEPGRLGRDGVAILTVMEARGLAFDHVIVPGLVEKSFPARARPDPLLFDDERESLAKQTGRPLAPRTLHRPAEERLLFAIASDAARGRLVLTASRRDSALDRERTLSQFFTRARDAAGRVRQTRLGSTTTFGPAVSLSEARHRALDSDGAEALAAVFPPLEAALARRAAREQPFGPFEGLLESPDLSAMLAAHVPGPSKSVSPSAIEMFCKCAYQYYFKHVVKLRPIEETEEPADLGPLELGKLVHDAARRAAGARRGKPFGDLKDDRALSKLAAACASEALDAFETENGFVLSPPLMREIAQGRVRDHVQAWLLFERRGARGVYAPAGAEVRFGQPTGPDRFADPALSSDEPALSEQGAPLHGQIDLVSVDASAGLTRVTDFKVKLSGKAVDAIARQRREGAVVWFGEMLQLPVYALAAAGPVGRKGDLPAAIASEYLFLAADPDLDSPSVRVESVGLDPAGTLDAVARLELILETMRASVSDGVFRPRPVGTLRPSQCQLCDFQTVCGPDHVRLFQNKAEHPDAAVARLDALSRIL